MGRKKKAKVEKKKIGLDSLGEYKAGDTVYCFRFPDKILSKGKIIRFFSTQQDFAEFIDDISGQFRATLLEDIISNPTRSQISSVNSKIARKVKVAKNNSAKK